MARYLNLVFLIRRLGGVLYISAGKDTKLQRRNGCKRDEKLC
jgi:hypothetical protein